MITLGSRRFTGPFIAALWTPPRAPGLYAVMVPGRRLLMFHAVHFGQAACRELLSLATTTTRGQAHAQLR